MKKTNFDNMPRIGRSVAERKLDELLTMFGNLLELNPSNGISTKSATEILGAQIDLNAFFLQQVEGSKPENRETMHNSKSIQESQLFDWIMGRQPLMITLESLCEVRECYAQARYIMIIDRFAYPQRQGAKLLCPEHAKKIDEIYGIYNAQSKISRE